MLVAFLVSSMVFSQVTSKGPTRKNEEIGKRLSTKTKLVFDSNHSLQKGPEAKNFKVWNKESSGIAIRTRKVINNPKGLSAKNRKVWEEVESNAVETKASYKLPKNMRKRKSWWH
jgi:hypothetical protein